MKTIKMSEHFKQEYNDHAVKLGLAFHKPSEIINAKDSRAMCLQATNCILYSLHIFLFASIANYMLHTDHAFLSSSPVT